MKKSSYQCLVLMILTIGAFHLQAGTIFYVPIPAAESDTNSGITSDNTYTSAVDGGNASGTDRVVNGVTLHALAGSGQTSTADNCTLNALAGTLADGGGASASIQADGTMGQVLTDMTFNNDASDDSQQEVVLDPASLTAGKTYDLRVYIANGSGQNRLVNLSFACDGQGAVETGFFNEDDATTSAGGFTDKNQVYYVDYRYTWDGATTPGITITQKSGSTPFCLYALTNQEISGVASVLPSGATGPALTMGAASVAAPAAESSTDSGAASTSEAASSAASAITTGYTSEQTDVGVTSEEFQNCDCLKRHGKWVFIEGYGRCWQPGGVTVNWRPYTHGHWGHGENCGYTWICDSDEEEWGWACYHYGRWTNVEQTGWCWVPGRQWASSWVSWREGTGDCSCVGWAPLPPQATCGVGIGISTWVDNTWNIGPGAYSFCHISDFGAASLAGVLISQQQNVNIFQKTVNVTNIVNNNTNIYNGGPNLAALNGQIAKQGGKPIPTLIVDRWTKPGPAAGGKYAELKGNVLTLSAPKVTPVKNLAALPAVATTIKAPKVDHGWNQIKDAKLAATVKSQIASEAKGKTPQNSPAKLPQGVTLPGPALQAAGGTPGVKGNAGQPASSGRVTGPISAAASGKPLPISGIRHPGQPLTGVAASPAKATSLAGKPTPGVARPGQPIAGAAASPAHVAATSLAGKPAAKVAHPGQPIAGAAASPAHVAATSLAGKPAAKVAHPGQPIAGAAASPAHVAAPSSTGGPTPKVARPGQPITGAAASPAHVAATSSVGGPTPKVARPGQPSSEQAAHTKEAETAVNKPSGPSVQQKQAQQQQAQQQKRLQQQQALQEQKQAQQQKAVQQQKQAQERQALQHQQKQAQLQQAQQQQAQQQRQAQQQALQQQRLLQQQQARQRAQAAQPVKKGKPTPTPVPR